MEKIKLVMAKSLLDFEEAKYTLANNNSMLISSDNVKERYFLNNKISFKDASYQTLLQNCYIIELINDREYLTYRSYINGDIYVSKLCISEEYPSSEFLNHLGYKEVFEVEMSMYTYKKDAYEIQLINIIGVGLFVGANSDNLGEVAQAFELPISDIISKEEILKKIINKERRYM